ncbi:hypothetical protein MMC28_001813 [Mycoblastus sanguinarius]|nr:hypothetical protein [Mycoblastus sanguinarius]
MATGGHQSTCEKRDTPATSVSRCKLELTNAGIEPQPEVSTQLCIFLFEDAPRGHSSVSDFSEGNSTSTESQSLKGHETDPTTVSPVDQEHLAREQADFDGTFQEPQEALSVDSSSSLVVEISGSPTSQSSRTFDTATVKEVAAHIPSDSSDVLEWRGKEAEAIIKGTGRVFGDHSTRELCNDSERGWMEPSNPEEDEARREGLRRAHKSTALVSALLEDNQCQQSPLLLHTDEYMATHRQFVATKIFPSAAFAKGPRPLWAATSSLELARTSEEENLSILGHTIEDVEQQFPGFRLSSRSRNAICLAIIIVVLLAVSLVVHRIY